MISVSILSLWYFGDFGTLFFFGAPKKTRLVVSNISISPRGNDSIRLVHVFSNGWVETTDKNAGIFQFCFCLQAEKEEPKPDEKVSTPGMGDWQKVSAICLSIPSNYSW